MMVINGRFAGPGNGGPLAIEWTGVSFIIISVMLSFYASATVLVTPDREAPGLFTHSHMKAVFYLSLCSSFVSPRPHWLDSWRHACARRGNRLSWRYRLNKGATAFLYYQRAHRTIFRPQPRRAALSAASTCSRAFCWDKWSSVHGAREPVCCRQMKALFKLDECTAKRRQAFLLMFYGLFASKNSLWFPALSDLDALRYYAQQGTCYQTLASPFIFIHRNWLFELRLTH